MRLEPPRMTSPCRAGGSLNADAAIRGAAVGKYDQSYARLPLSPAATARGGNGALSLRAARSSHAAPGEGAGCRAPARLLIQAGATGHTRLSHAGSTRIWI